MEAITELPDVTTMAFPWCATCGGRLVMDWDGWLVHTWQAGDQAFTDERYPIVWKAETETQT